jgi:hypothetical protein
MKKSALAIALSAVMLLGAIGASSRNAYAHNFSGDESASFLAKVQELKVQTHLIQQDASTNKTLVPWHVDKISEFWNANDTKEMAERNQRLSKEIPDALGNLTAAVNSSNPNAAKIKQIVASLDGSLAEATSARIDQTALNNATVKALAIANVLDETVEDYGIALGGKEGDNSSSSANGNMSAPASSNTGGPVSIVNPAAHQTAQGLAAAAQNMFNDLKTQGASNASSAVTDLGQAFAKLTKAIDVKTTKDDVDGIVHGTILPDLQRAFNFKMPAAEGGSS